MPNDEVYIRQIGPGCGAYVLLYWYYKFVVFNNGTVPVENIYDHGHVLLQLIGVKHQADLLYQLIKCDNALMPGITQSSLIKDPKDYVHYKSYSNPYDIMMFCNMFGKKKVTLYLGPDQLEDHTKLRQLKNSPIKELNLLLEKSVNAEWLDRKEFCHFQVISGALDLNSVIKPGDALIAFCYLADPAPKFMHYVLVYRDISGKLYGVNPWTGITTLLKDSDIKLNKICTKRGYEEIAGFDTVYFAFSGILIEP